LKQNKGRLIKIIYEFKEGFRCGGFGGTLSERRRRRSEFGFRREKAFRSNSSDFYGTVTFFAFFFVWKIKKNVEPYWERFENMACVMDGFN